jgi:hypothetical protein
LCAPHAKFPSLVGRHPVPLLWLGGPDVARNLTETARAIRPGGRNELLKAYRSAQQVARK